MTYHLASACFQVGTSDTEITVENIPFEFDPNKGHSRDDVGAYHVAVYIGANNLTEGKPVTLRWVETSKGI